MNVAEKQKVLAVCSFIPFPAHRGDPVRVLGTLKLLASKVDLTVYCVDSNSGDIEGLRTQIPGADVRCFNPTYQRRLGILSDVRRYLVGAVLGVPSWVQKRASKHVVKALQTEDASSILIAFGEAAAVYIPKSRRLWHWDKFNVMTVSMLPEKEGQVSRSTRATVSQWLNYHSVRKYEARLMKKCSSVSVTNADEARRIRRAFGRDAVVVPNLVKYPSVVERRVVPGQLLWLGNLEYESNTAGLFEFLNSAWAHLEDSVTLRVVGSGMSDSIRVRLKQFNGVRAVGFVEDLENELLSAELGIIPLWSGGGTKIKSLTMMAHGLPVVSTTMGMEGIASDDEGLFYPARNPSDFPLAIRTALDDDGRVARGVAGRARILQRFSEESVGAQIDVMLMNIGRSAHAGRRLNWRPAS